jgi:ATP dependent DNA ligase domain
VRLTAGGRSFLELDPDTDAFLGQFASLASPLSFNTGMLFIDQACSSLKSVEGQATTSRRREGTKFQANPVSRTRTFAPCIVASRTRDRSTFSKVLEADANIGNDLAPLVCKYLIVGSYGRDRTADPNVTYKRFADLRDALLGDFKCDNAIVKGELVVLDDQGQSLFMDLMANRKALIFAAFDLLWLDGGDLRDRKLIERKKLLQKIIKKKPARTLYISHIVGKGKTLFKEVCARDLEGIVAKPAISPYRLVKGGRHGSRFVIRSTARKRVGASYSNEEGRCAYR